MVENYDDLITNESRELPDKLYLGQLERKYGKDADQVSCFECDNKLRTEGFVVSLPIDKEDK